MKKHPERILMEKYSIISKVQQRVLAFTSSPHQAKEKARKFSMDGESIYIQNSLGVNVELYIDGKSTRERKIEKDAPTLKNVESVKEEKKSFVVRRSRGDV